MKIEVEATFKDLEAKELMPEKRLLWAILNRAVIDLNEPKKQAMRHEVYRRQNKASALEFLNANASKASPPFSFKWICEHLDLDDEIESILKVIKSQTI